MPFYMYILRSGSTGKFYVGHTEHLMKRLSEHNRNRTPSICIRGAWELAYWEEFSTRAQASRREESRIAELERKVGCQAMEIDFLRRCLQRVEEQRKLQALGARAFPPLTTFRGADFSGRIPAEPPDRP